MRKVFVVHGENTKFIGKLHPDFIWKGHPDFGKRENPDLEYYILEALELVLKNAEVSPELVDIAFVGNFAGELFAHQGHLGALLAQYPGFEGKPSFRVEGACASGGLAVFSAVQAIWAGCDVAIALGAEVQTTYKAREGADFLARAAYYKTQRKLDDFTFPCLFARRTKHLLEKGWVTREDLAKVVVKAYRNANRNPKAHMHYVQVTLEEALEESETNPCFLSNEEYKPYLRVKDCSQVSDGGSAVILASLEGLKKMGKKPDEVVEIVAIGVATSPLKEESDPLRLLTTKKAAEKAYQMAGISPKSIDIAEVHDCFSVNEILMYEALGFAEEGKGATLIREGVTEIEGDLPVNPGGGLIAFGHPVGATGVKQIAEIYRQMKGLCGNYQVPKSPQWGVAANMGGDDKTAVVTILRAP